VRRQRRARCEVDAEERPAFSLDFLDEAALDALPAANWRVHGLLLRGSLGLSVGEPGSCKTFVWLDLGLSIAAGLKTWLGRKLNAQGAVVYVAAEGQGRFKYRKNVWKQVHGITRPLPFYTLTLHDVRLCS
jgi:AAA domain